MYNKNCYHALCQQVRGCRLFSRHAFLSFLVSRSFVTVAILFVCKLLYVARSAHSKGYLCIFQSHWRNPT
jgi:hypothetical protein